MALWYQCDNSTWWWWSYVADLGPYDGTVPLPRPLWLPNEAAEIDYVVGIPHPSGDPRRFRDGTYDYHVLEGDFSGSYSYWSTPGGALVGGTYGSPTGPAPGAHLFVQFYRSGYPSAPTLPPSKPALAYVPSTVIAGGYGPTIGSGHWSAWQTGEIHEAAGAPSALAGAMRYGGAGAAGFVDPRPLVQTARNNIEAGSGSPWSLPNGGTGPGYQEQTGGYPLGYLFDQEKVTPDQAGSLGQVQIAMTGATFDVTDAASYRNPFPALLSGLTEGVDYAANPDSGDVVEYDAGADSVFQGWNDWQIDSRTYSWQANGGAFVNPSSVRIKVKDGIASPGWVASSDSTWTDIGGISFPTDIASGLFAPLTTNVMASDTFSLSALTQPKYSVMAMPELTDPSSPLGMDEVLAPTGGGTFSQDGHYSNISLNGSTRTSVLWMEETENQPQFQDENMPVGRWALPRWRYWVPGGLEFHCPGGARPRVTVVEGHWSEWIEGDLVTDYTSWRIHPQGQWDENQMDVEYSTNDTFGAPLPPGGTLPVAWPDLAAYMDDELAGARAGSLVRFDGEDEAGTDFFIFKRWLYDGPSVYYQQAVASFRIYQDVATYDATDLLDGFGSDYYSYFASHGITNYGPNPTTGLIYDGESSLSTVLGWDDWESTLASIAGQPSWEDVQQDTGSGPFGPPPPPDTSTPVTMPYLIRASSAPLSVATNSRSLDSALPFLGSSDGDLLTTVTLPSTAGGTANITIPLSDLGPVPGFTIFFRPQLLESGSMPFGDPVMPNYGYTRDRRSRIRGTVQNLSSYTYDNLDPSTRGNVPIVRIRRPRWRYWIPGDTTIQCTAPILRLNQRNDGRGSSRHPRLLSSTSAPSSRQRSAAPRLGPNGHYL